MNIHEQQIEHYRSLRPYLTAAGRAAADDQIERARLRDQIARDYSLGIKA